MGPVGIHVDCLAHPAGYMMCYCFLLFTVFFIFNGRLGDQLSQDVLNRSSSHFRIDKHRCRCTTWPSFSDRSRDVDMATN